MQDAIAQETIHDTLAGEWRQRMATRGAMAAVLLAVPILVAAAIGFSAGGGLPFGISSFASGPGDSSSSGSDKAGHGSDSISRLIGSSASAATVSPVSTAGGGSGSGGNSDATRGSGGSTGGGGGGSHGTTVTGTTGTGSSGGGSSTGNGGGGNSITVPNPTSPSGNGPTIQVPNLPVSPPSVPNPGGSGNPLGGVTGALPGGGTSGQSSGGGNPLGGIGDAVGVQLP
jgi:hypothetical protein